MTAPKTRISRKIRAAIVQMVDHGRSRSEAAEAVQITDDWLYRELRRPEVLAYRNQRREVLRTGEGARSIKRIADLAQSASSEGVKFDANRLLLATDPAEPIVPLQRNESTINHKGLGPGLTIVMLQPEHPPLPVIDGTSNEVPNEYRHLPEPVPHPTSRPVPFLSREKHLSAPVPHPSDRPGGEFYGRAFPGGARVVQPSRAQRDSSAIASATRHRGQPDE
jgi:hypothetical protein